MTNQESRDDFNRAIKWYEEHKSELLQKYEVGTYLAITGDPPEVVDSDTEFHYLSTRVRQKYGYRAFAMPELTIGRKIIKLRPRIKVVYK